ncbi:hypothetical protein CQW23_21580 [Capsicum baccatum]|uniref:Uncharacterized protein n=1 Tax=Capsicum baccatum TaxID=33114 RepID=A0A2G2VYE0_CAPBA|nr:hypothetical protein CQW23_21580 [Capsicum baccatum]
MPPTLALETLEPFRIRILVNFLPRRNFGDYFGLGQPKSGGLVLLFGTTQSRLNSILSPLLYGGRLSLCFDRRPLFKFPFHLKSRLENTFNEVVVFGLVELGKEGLDLGEVLDAQVLVAELKKFENGLVYWSLGLGGDGLFGLWHLVEQAKDLTIVAMFQEFDYSLHDDHANQFYLAIRKYYPGLKDGSLEPGYAGIKPKLFGPEEGPTDFVVQGEETHGISSLVNLFGIESPGLTFSMVITEHTAAKLLK